MNSYVDKDGQNREFTAVVVERVHFPIEKKSTASESAAEAVSAPPPVNNTDFAAIQTDEDLPF